MFSSLSTSYVCLQISLAAELSVREPNYRILRRRVCWLLGQVRKSFRFGILEISECTCCLDQWSGVKLSPALRPRLYQLLMPMIADTEDLVVRLAAAKALKVVIDDFEFSVEELEPYLQQVCRL